VRPPTESDALKDPVCGRLVGAASPHRHVHGGAVFCFCGPQCRGLFIEDPSRYVVFRLQPGARGSSAATDDQRLSDPTDSEATRPAKPSPTSLPTRIEFSDFAETIPGAGTLVTLHSPGTVVRQPQAGGAPAARDPFTLAGGMPGNRWRDVLAGAFPWGERRFAKRVSRELLELYRSVSAKHARLRGRDLYREVVMARKRASPASAEALLEQAEESYAMWPTPRALMFRDVVHFIAVSEFLASHGDTPWIQTNVRHEVESLIPHNL